MRPLLVLIFITTLISACNSREEALSSPAKVSESARRSVPLQEKNFRSTSVQAETGVPVPAGQEKGAGEGETSRPPAEGARPNSARTSRFLQESVQAKLVEYPTAALPVWRECRELRPTLVLLSNDPFLEPVPAQLRGEAARLLRQGPDGEILTRSIPYRSDPVLMPTMAVEAALQAGLFDRVVWILPTDAAKEKLSAEAFRKQLLDFGAIDEKEAKTLKLKGSAFSGAINGVPWTVVPLSEFKGVEGPTVIHIDLSFLRPLYRNEIKTPLHPLIGSIFRTLQEAKLQTCGVTVSLSQLTRHVPLDTRFLGSTMASLVKNPAILEEGLPPNWDRRGQIFYLRNFFQKERIHQLALAMEKEDPKDPSVLYALYQSCRDMKDGDKALEILGRAVSLDKIYALEYLDLTEVAGSKGLPDEVLRMFGLAEKAFPDDPFITLDKARFLISAGKGREALSLIAKLKKLRWSQVYRADIQEVLTNLEEKARQS